MARCLHRTLNEYPLPTARDLRLHCFQLITAPRASRSKGNRPNVHGVLIPAYPTAATTRPTQFGFIVTGIGYTYIELQKSHFARANASLIARPREFLFIYHSISNDEPPNPRDRKQYFVLSEPGQKLPRPKIVTHSSSVISSFDIYLHFL